MPRCQYIKSNYQNLIFCCCVIHVINRAIKNTKYKKEFIIVQQNQKIILGQAPYYSRNLLHVSNFDFDGPLSVQGFALDLMLIKANNGFLRDLEFPPLQKAKTNLVPCGRLRLGNLKILYTYDNFHDFPLFGLSCRAKFVSQLYSKLGDTFCRK